MKLTDFKKNALLLSASSMGMLLLIEIFLRALAPQPTYSRLLSQLGSYYAASDYNTFTLKTNYVGTQPSMESSEKVSVTTNSSGLRGAELSEDPKVLMLGDSYTFGVYVNDDEIFSAAIERQMRKDGYTYQVVNAGYADGFETDQQYVWLKHNIGKIVPKLVVLNVFLGNDIYFINPSAWYDVDADGLPSKWLDADLYVQPNGILRNTQAGIATVGVQGIYRLPILRDSHVCILVGRAVDKLRFRLSGEGEGFKEEALQHIFGVYSERFLDREARFLKLLSAMDRMVRSTGAKFVVTLLPMNFMIDRDKMDLVLPRSKFRQAESVYYDRLSQLLASRGLPLLNIEKAMKQGNEGPFFPANGEVHFNRRGHAFTADRIYEFLRTGGYLSTGDRPERVNAHKQ
jgi:lysophospholipase L1-like esterase